MLDMIDVIIGMILGKKSGGSGENLAPMGYVATDDIYSNGEVVE